jgi:hypothetical protein
MAFNPHHAKPSEGKALAAAKLIDLCGHEAERSLWPTIGRALERLLDLDRLNIGKLPTLPPKPCFVWPCRRWA